MSKFEFPSKLNRYRKQLVLLYRGEENTLLSDILQKAPAKIQEEVSYDNWNGGQFGHSITFFVDDSTYSKLVNFENRNQICEKICKDFNQAMGSIQNESIDSVHIELYDEDDEDCIQAVQPSGLPTANPASAHIWNPKSLRLFISHRSKHKKAVSELAESLSPFGVSSFVAHEDIKPTKKWLKEIDIALNSMDALLVFLTDDFTESDWTDQETGFALARKIPIIPLKMEKTDPYGFIGNIQAIRGNSNNPTQTSKLVFNTLIEHFDGSGKIKAATISAFIYSKSYLDTMAVFERLKDIPTFSIQELNELVAGFNKNNQLFGCAGINRKNQFLKFINKHGNDLFESKGGKILRIKNDEIPF